MFRPARMFRISYPANSLNAPSVTLLLRKHKFCKPRVNKRPVAKSCMPVSLLCRNRCATISMPEITGQLTGITCCSFTVKENTHHETSSCNFCGGSVFVSADGPGAGAADAQTKSRGQEAGLLHGHLEDGR